MRFLPWRSRTTRVITAVVATTAVVASTFFVGVTVANAAQSQSASTKPYTYMVRSETAQKSFTSTTWVDVPGSHMSLSALSSNFVAVRFGAQSICEGPSGWCSVRIVGTTPVNGSNTEFNPVDGYNFVWSWAGGTWGQTAMERHLPVVVLPKNPPAWQTYTVKVQVAVRNGATRFRLQDWTLAVEVVG